MATNPIIRDFNQIAPMLIQKYEHYLPNAFDESLTMLQKLNTIVTFLNSVVEEYNRFGEGLIGDVQKHEQSVLNRFKEMGGNIDQLGKDIKDFQTAVKQTLLPENVRVILNEWDANGKFEAMLNNEVLGHKAEIGFMKNGQILMPPDFPLQNIPVVRKTKRVYEHSATPHTVHNWKNATNIYISGTSNYSGLGTTAIEPVTLKRFNANITGNLYGSQKDFIVHILDNVYSADSGMIVSGNYNFYIKSASPTGKTWVGRMKRPGIEATEWEVYNGIYRTTITDAPHHPIIDVVNMKHLDAFGTPFPYVEVNSVAECQSKPGSFVKIEPYVYAHPYKGHDIRFAAPLTTTHQFALTAMTGKVVFENIKFLAESYRFDGASLTNEFHLFSCLFYRGKQDAYGITGVFKSFAYDTVAAYASKDGFNYHTSNPDSIGFEVNCYGYGNGKYKITGGNSGTGSNNGSTAHDGMNMLRIGCKYWDNEGPTVADVNDCYTISIGCEVGNILSTTSGIRSAFWLSADINKDTAKKKKYVVECLQNGKDFAMSVQTDVPQLVYVMDLESTKPMTAGMNVIDWEGVAK